MNLLELKARIRVVVVVLVAVADGWINKLVFNGDEVTKHAMLQRYYSAPFFSHNRFGLSSYSRPATIET